MEESRKLSDPKALLIRSQNGTGSGFFVAENLIVTNIHVVTKGTLVSAGLIDPKTNSVIKQFDVVDVTAFDPQNDLVILKIIGKGIPLPIGDNDLLRNGDIVQVVGYPNRQYKVTKGPVHSIRDSDKWIRMKFKTESGNSGGPVLNGDGEVVGVAIADTDYFSFAIPVSAVKILLVQTQEREPLAQWQEREQIRAYTCLVQSQKKHSQSLHREAIDDLDKAIQLNPNCVFFYYNRGIMKSELGRLKTDEGDLVEAKQYHRDTIDDCTKAIKLCPDYASAYNNRGTAKSNLGQSKFDEGNVAEAQQYYQDAIADYTETIKLCPDYALIYNNRADVKCHFGKSEGADGNVEAAQNLYQAAIIDVNTAIDLDSNVALYYHTRGEIMYAFGDYSAAIKDYEKAIEIDPNYTDVREDLELAKKALEQLEEVPTKD